MSRSMNLALYSGSNPVGLQDLKVAIEGIAPEHDVTAYGSLVDLRRGLLRPWKRARLAILKAGTREELEGLFLLRDLLVDMRVVLIVPDQDEATLTLAHRFQPRFLMHAKADPESFRAILSNMLRLYR
jgi:hypothetical protein